MISVAGVKKTVTILVYSLVFSVVTILVANKVASIYLKSNPEILMSAAERINETTRSVRETMIPKEKITEWYDLENPEDLKPMWEEAYGSNPIFESYVHYRTRAYVGNYYGVTGPGYRMVKDQGVWPPVSENFNIFFFGGSTSFGVGPYWATVASYLQEQLNEKSGLTPNIRVYNFGRSGYHTNQEQILLHRLISDGFVPDAVVFMDGLNDFCFRDGNPSGWQGLQQFFNETNKRAQSQSAAHGVVTKWYLLKDFIVSLPILRLTNALLSRITEEEIPQYTAPKAAINEPIPDPNELEVVINRYLANMSQVQAVGDAYDFLSIFVWQPIPTYKYDTQYHLFNPDRLGCHTGSKFGYPMMAERVKNGLPLKNFVWAADLQENVEENIYIDAFHYTAPFSKTISEFIADEIEPLIAAEGSTN